MSAGGVGAADWRMIGRLGAENFRIRRLVLDNVEDRSLLQLAARHTNVQLLVLGAVAEQRPMHQLAAGVGHIHCPQAGPNRPLHGFGSMTDHWG